MLLQMDACSSSQTFLKFKSVLCSPVRLRVSIKPRLCLSAPASQVFDYMLKLCYLRQQVGAAWSQRLSDSCRFQAWNNELTRVCEGLRTNRAGVFSVLQTNISKTLHSYTHLQHLDTENRFHLSLRKESRFT